MLRRFALGLQEQPSQPNSSMSNLYESIVPALKTHVTNATNGTNFADSAYASASASGQGSSAQSGSASVNSKAHFKPSAKIRQQNIHTYLHDIPEGLMPRQRPAMSEKAKKKMTVRRLEQIFSGKGAGKGAHHHPIQQEEVSQLAAKADRSAIEATGQRAVVEGNREACIMYDEREEHSGADERTPIATGGSNAPINDTVQKPDEHNFVRSSFAPEQRPTRPLDLDPQRAQVPIDNIDYIRHLGFSPADAYTSRSPEEGHGWIYLNLLINMAQLHTINVTPEFVKQALQEYSSRFELSDDGRKVRWRRSSGYARLTSDADYTPSTSLTGSAEDQNPRKRIKLSHASNDLPHSQLKGALGDSQSKLAYTPLFFHQRSNEDSDISSSSSDEDDTDSPHLAHQLGGASSGATNPTGYKYGRAPVKKSKKRGNGPIIFYNNARFCTDLSGESKTEAAMAYNPIMYHVTTTHPVGVDPGPESGDDLAERKGLLNDAFELPDAMDLDDNPIPKSMELGFPPQTPMTSVSEKSPLDMEVSGIGGIYPSDNFSINVKIRHARTNGSSMKAAHQRISSTYPNRLTATLPNHVTVPGLSSTLCGEVVSTRKRNLPPSELPPASCFVSIDGSESDDGSDSGSTMSIPLDSLGQPPPYAAPQVMQLPSLDSDGEEDDDDDDDDQASDGSLDFLATARAIDPESVIARERAYDMEMAERLAEDIPTGSSAATAEGGSGFASPVDGVSHAEIEQARQALREQGGMPSLLRSAGSSDSMVVNGHLPSRSRSHWRWAFVRR